MTPPSLLIHNPGTPSRTEPAPPATMWESAHTAMGDAPWWGWALGGLAALVVGVLTIWLVWAVVARVLRTLAKAGKTLSESVTTKALADRKELAARAKAWGDMAVGWLLVGQFLTAMGFAAWVMGSTARDELGIPEPANWLLFVVFEGFALVIMALIKQRAEEGMPYPGLLVGYWATIGLASVVVSTHGDDLVQRVVFACITLFAGATYALRMHAKRKVQEEELLKAGERWASRRIALVRWLHPVERIKVTFDMASDENLSADAATQRVRVRGARDAIWVLGQAKQEPMATSTWRVRRQIQREHRLERRAQRAIARAGLAGDPQVVAVLENELRMMAMASTLATADHIVAPPQEPVEGLDVVEEASEPELEFGAAWFGELGPARLDADGRIEPDRSVAEFVDRTDPWEALGRTGQTEPVEPSGPGRVTGPVRLDRSEQTALAGLDRAGLVDQAEQSDPVEENIDRTGLVGPDEQTERTGPVQESESIEPDRVEEEQTGPVPAEVDQTEPDRTGPEQTGPVGLDRIDADRSEQTGPDQGAAPTGPDRAGLRTGMTLDTGSGRLRVKTVKKTEPDQSGIRVVDSSSGPYKTLDELKVEMEQAVREGRLGRNVVDRITVVLRIGKPRARKLRTWAQETGLFERISVERSESSQAAGTLEETPTPSPASSTSSSSFGVS